jgi:hypothetical protein
VIDAPELVFAYCLLVCGPWLGGCGIEWLWMEALAAVLSILHIAVVG